MSRAWIIGVLVAACDAHTPTPTSSTPSAGDPTPATAQTLKLGASNPSECEEEPSAQPDLLESQKVIDAALARLDKCTQRLTIAGHVAVSILSDVTGAATRVYVTQSTVRDCPVVDCVRKELARLRVPSTVRSSGLDNVELELRPREHPSRTTDVKWPDGDQGRYCVDSEDVLKEFEHGRLPPEKIQSIIRDRYPAIRGCYEVALASNPHLKGRITTRFVIGRDGRVFGAYVLANEVPDCRVAQCVRDEISRCVFPKPRHGIVTVVYPLMFEPG